MTAWSMSKFRSCRGAYVVDEALVRCIEDELGPEGEAKVALVWHVNRHHTHPHSRRVLHRQVAQTTTRADCKPNVFIVHE